MNTTVKHRRKPFLIKLNRLLYDRLSVILSHSFFVGKNQVFIIVGFNLSCIYCLDLSTQNIGQIFFNICLYGISILCHVKLAGRDEVPAVRRKATASLFSSFFLLIDWLFNGHTRHCFCFSRLFSRHGDAYSISASYDMLLSLNQHLLLAFKLCLQLTNLILKLLILDLTCSMCSIGRLHVQIVLRLRLNVTLCRWNSRAHGKLVTLVNTLITNDRRI